MSHENGMSDPKEPLWRREVLVLIARGHSSQELADLLFISENTMKTHVKRILMKIGARDRTQAVVIAYEAGLVS